MKTNLDQGTKILAIQQATPKGSDVLTSIKVLRSLLSSKLPLKEVKTNLDQGTKILAIQQTAPKGSYVVEQGLLSMLNSGQSV